MRIQTIHQDDYEKFLVEKLKLNAVCINFPGFHVFEDKKNILKDYDSRINELKKAINFNSISNELKFDRTLEYWIHHSHEFGSLLLTFDTEIDAENFYYGIIGEDGPTKYNNYNGPLNVHALLYLNGEIITENT